MFIPLRTKQSLIFSKEMSVSLNSQIRIITMLVFVQTGNLRIPLWDQLQWHGVHNVSFRNSTYFTGGNGKEVMHPSENIYANRPPVDQPT